MNDPGHDSKITLASLSNQNLWVAWRLELNKDGKLTKLPKNPHTGGNAQVPNNPKTFGTCAEAILRHEIMDGNGGIGNRSRSYRTWSLLPTR
jgi:hypothetical protein